MLQLWKNIIINMWLFMKNFKEFSTISLIIALLYIFYNFIGIGCPIKFLTGISCAGRGMTRALICFLHLDIFGAFYYHPLFFLPIIYFFLFLFKEQIPSKFFNSLLFVGISLFLTIYIYRIFNPDDIVININIKNGFIYKAFIFLQNGGV